MAGSTGPDGTQAGAARAAAGWRDLMFGGWSEAAALQARQVGLPIVLGAAIGAGAAAFPPTRDAAIAAFVSVRDAFLARPEFRIARVELAVTTPAGAAPADGAERLTDAVVLGALGLDDPERRGALGYDVRAAKTALENLGWVERAAVAVRPPETLAVTVVERRPAAVWRADGALTLIDAGGARIAPLETRAGWARLPLIVGAQANAAEHEGALVREAIGLYRRAQAAGLRPLAAVRVGARRWDVDLLDGRRLMLPEDGPYSALEHAIGYLAAAEAAGERFTALDLRIAFQPTARRAAPPPRPG
ncbi:MAG: cell division protein FtsQ/DivIB, partial [Pseudomonadota bacterium]